MTDTNDIFIPDLKQQAEIKHILDSSGKCFVAIGVKEDKPVFIKSLLPKAAEWKEKFSHEIALYRLFQQTAPNIKIPQIVYADDDLLILDYIEGQTLESERYLTTTLSSNDIHEVLQITKAIASWKPKDIAMFSAWDYHERLQKYRKRELFSDKETIHLSNLIDSYKEPFEIAHGDLLLKNIIRTPKQEYVLIDWEFAGLFMPGFDLALLHTIMFKDEASKKAIENEVSLNKIELPFLINKAMIIARETHIHRELPNDMPIKKEILDLLAKEKETLQL